MLELLLIVLQSLAIQRRVVKDPLFIPVGAHIKRFLKRLHPNVGLAPILISSLVDDAVLEPLEQAACVWLLDLGVVK